MSRRLPPVGVTAKGVPWRFGNQVVLVAGTGAVQGGVQARPDAGPRYSPAVDARL